MKRRMQHQAASFYLDPRLQRREEEMKIPTEHDRSAIEDGRLNGARDAPMFGQTLHSQRLDQSHMCDDQPSTKSEALEGQLEELKAVVRAQQTQLDKKTNEIMSLSLRLDALERTHVEGVGGEAKELPFSCCDHHAGKGEPGAGFVTEKERLHNYFVLKTLFQRRYFLTPEEKLCSEFDPVSRVCRRRELTGRCTEVHNVNPRVVVGVTPLMHCRNYLSCQKGRSSCSRKCTKVHNTNPDIVSGVYNSDPKYHHPS